jgi:transposase
MIKYPTDLCDSQWQIIKDFLNIQRKRKHDLKQIVNAIFYLVKTGCQWRMLPVHFPKWQIVYYYFTRWKHARIIERIRCFLIKSIRVKQGKKKQPSVGIVDAQSVKSTLVSNRSNTGYDGGKKIKGIKRHIVVDTSGLLLCVVVHSAGIADRKGGAMVLQKLGRRWNGIKKIFTDGGYPLPGKASEKNQVLSGYPIEVATRKEMNKFKVLPKRWIVERTFAWIDTNRRNAKSYERLSNTAEAITELSVIRFMLKQV